MVSAMMRCMWTKEVEKLEAYMMSINPNFEKDGKLFIEGEIEMDACALVIGPNKKMRKVDIPEAMDILENLSDHMEGSVIGDTTYVGFFCKGRTFSFEGTTYLKGGMIALKATSYGIEFLTNDDYEAVKELMESSKAVIRTDDAEYTVFKLRDGGKR